MWGLTRVYIYLWFLYIGPLGEGVGEKMTVVKEMMRKIES